jgi:hypothetical protein
MARQLQLELANFILRFGDSLTLADRLEEIVIPAFVQQRQRPSRGSTYFFHEVRLINAGQEKQVFPVIAGRFVKDTKISRRQVYDPHRGLIEDNVEIDTAPASFFVLILEGHKLLYVKEEAGAPSVGVFATTAERFLVAAWDEYVDSIYTAAKMNAGQGQARVTKKRLEQETPRPTLDVIEIATEQTFGDFVQNFDKLKLARIRLFQTNDEVDNSSFIKTIREMKERAKSKTTAFQHQNPKGLDKKEVAEQFKPALVEGQAKVILSGVDEEGQELVGDNRQFKLRVGLLEEQLNHDVKEAANELIDVYRRLVAKGDIAVGDVPAATKAKLAQAARVFTD